jgi:hypothetical protein
VRTFALLITAALLISCSSFEGTSAKVEDLGTDLKAGSRKVASATVSGAEAVGDSVGTAYHGVKQGFQEPDDRAYGPYPKNYVNKVRNHMLRFGGVEKSAGFTFGKPERSYLNKGLLLGGEIEWQGWVVEVAVQTTTRFGQPQVDEYVVRMNDGEVIEVVEKDHAGALKRADAAETAKPSAAAAPQR